MKEWWLNLALREKQMVAGGVVLLVLFFIYEIFFATLFDANASLRSKIHKNQTLLAWMKDSDKRIQELQNTHTTVVANDSSSLLSRVQNALDQTSLQKDVLQLQQADNDSIEIHFRQTGFDNLMNWLIQLCRAQQLTIIEMSAKPAGADGTVDVSLKLKHG